MNDEQRRFLAIKEGLNSPFWAWLKIYLNEQANQVMALGVNIIPSNQFELTEREQLFGKAKILNELVEQIPSLIESTMKELGEK
jgi:hypothetical protein